MKTNLIGAGILAGLTIAAQIISAAEDLAAGFANPPQSARAQVW